MYLIFEYLKDSADTQICIASYIDSANTSKILFDGDLILYFFINKKSYAFGVHAPPAVGLNKFLIIGPCIPLIMSNLIILFI